MTPSPQAARGGANRLFTALKSLPLIRLALAVGAAVVMTIGAAATQVWLLYADDFPAAEMVWIERIKGAVTVSLAAMAIIFVVVLALAFGQIARFRLKVRDIVESDFDFDDGDGDGDDPEPPHTSARRRR